MGFGLAPRAINSLHLARERLYGLLPPLLCPHLSILTPFLPVFITMSFVWVILVGFLYHPHLTFILYIVRTSHNIFVYQ